MPRAFSGLTSTVYHQNSHLLLGEEAGKKLAEGEPHLERATRGHSEATTSDVSLLQEQPEDQLCVTGPRPLTKQLHANKCSFSLLAVQLGLLHRCAPLRM